MARRVVETAELTRLICERPLPLRIGGRSFLIWPPSLGKSLMVTSLMEMLGIGSAATPAELTATLEASPDVCMRMLAFILCRGRDELFDEEGLAEKVKTLKEETSPADRVTLLHAYLSYKPSAHWTRALGIDAERRRAEKAMRAKEKGSSVTVGAVSLFGSLIDAACQRYGWTYDYVVWGVSLVNLQLLLADAQQVIYLTDKERKRAGISTDGIRLDADDPRNQGMMEKILGGAP